jgi:hypothetical protein
MPTYFRQVPNFDYVSRDPENKKISDYATTKNLFRRGKLRDDIFSDLSFFTKYQIIGDERPDNVAYKVYGDATLDWVILLSNNILNIQSEWPMPQSVFDKVMLDKYGSYESLNAIHHYETKEVKNSLGDVIIKKGLRVDNNFYSSGNYISRLKLPVSSLTYFSANNELFIKLSRFIEIKKGDLVNITGLTQTEFNGTFKVDEVQSGLFENEIEGLYLSIDVDVADGDVAISNDASFTADEATIINASNREYFYQYYDLGLGSETLVSFVNFTTPITNYEYEEKVEEDKRNIFILKPEYLNIVFNDLEDIMTYKKGSSQYISRTLKQGDNIRLY